MSRGSRPSRIIIDDNSAAIQDAMAEWIREYSKIEFDRSIISPYSFPTTPKDAPMPTPRLQVASIRSSDLKLARTCEHQYWLRRRLGLDTHLDKTPKALRLGTFFHKVLEASAGGQMYLPRRRTNNLNIFKPEVKRNHAEEIWHAKAMADAVLRRDYGFPIYGCQIAYVEPTFAFRMGQTWVLSQPDLVLVDAHKKKIYPVDYKTTSLEPEERLRKVDHEFQTHLTLRVMQEWLRQTTNTFDGYELGGMLHLAVQKCPAPGLKDSACTLESKGVRKKLFMRATYLKDANWKVQEWKLDSEGKIEGLNPLSEYEHGGTELEITTLLHTKTGKKPGRLSVGGARSEFTYSHRIQAWYDRSPETIKLSLTSPEVLRDENHSRHLIRRLKYLHFLATTPNLSDCVLGDYVPARWEPNPLEQMAQLPPEEWDAFAKGSGHLRINRREPEGLFDLPRNVTTAVNNHQLWVPNERKEPVPA